MKSSRVYRCCARLLASLRANWPFCLSALWITSLGRQRKVLLRNALKSAMAGLWATRVLNSLYNFAVMKNVLRLGLWMSASFVFLRIVLPTNEAIVNIKAGTLIVIGVSRTSIVVASDSLVVDTMPGIEPTNTGKKIIPVGDGAACFMLGDSSLRWKQNGKTIDEVDFVEIIENWSKAHQKAQVLDAYDSIDATLLDEMKTMQRKHAFSDDPLHFILVTWVCVGYSLGKVTCFIAAITSQLQPKTSQNGFPMAKCSQGFSWR